MPWRSPSATSASPPGGGASGSRPASRAGGGGRNSPPSILRHRPLGRRLGRDRLLHFLLRLARFLVAAHLSLGHRSSPEKGVQKASPSSPPMSRAFGGSRPAR